MQKGILFFSQLLYFHAGVTPNNSFQLLLFVPALRRRDSGPSTGLVIDSSFPLQREKQQLECLWLNLAFKLQKLCIRIYTHIYMCMHVYAYVHSSEFH